MTEAPSPTAGHIHENAYADDVLTRLQHWRNVHIAHSGQLYEDAAAEIVRLRKLVLKYASKLSRAEHSLSAALSAQKEADLQ